MRLKNLDVCGIYELSWAQKGHTHRDNYRIISIVIVYGQAGARIAQKKIS